MWATDEGWSTGSNPDLLVSALTIPSVRQDSMELAASSRRHHSTHRELKLSQSVGSDAESARLRLSSAWEKMPKTKHV